MLPFRRAVAVFFSIALSFLLLMLVLLLGSRSMMQDEYRQSKQTLLQAALNNEKRELTRALYDHSSWDDAFRQMQLSELDPSWLESTFGADTISTNDMSGILILAPDFTERFNNSLQPLTAEQLLQVRDFVRQHQISCTPDTRLSSLQQSASSDFLTAAGQTIMLSAAPVVPNTFEASCEHLSYLVFWRLLDNGYLANMASNYGFSQLRLSSGTEPDATQSIQLNTSQPTRLLWSALAPPYNNLYKALGLSLVLTLILAVLALVFYRNIKRGHQDFYSLFEKNRAIQLLVNPLNGQIVMANQAAIAFYAYPGKDLLRLTLDNLSAGGISTLQLIGSANPCEVTQKLWNGVTRRVEINSGQIILAGEPLLYLIIHDVTQTHQAARELERSEARFRAIFEDASLGILQLDRYGHILDVNPAFCQMIGFPEENLTRWQWIDLIHHKERDATRRTYQALIDGVVDKLSHQQRFLNAGGEIIWTQMNISPVRINGEDSTYVALVENVNERMYLQQKLQDMAAKDPLTGLYNRRSMEEQAAREQSWSKRHGQSLCVMIADIDHFKLINDNYGHASGDIVLKEFAAVCNTHLRETDIFCRWGGEEFVILLTQTDMQQAWVVAERLREAVEKMRVRCHEQHIRLTVSLGLSDWNAEREDFISALERADTALYDAKRGGRNRTVIVNSEARHSAHP
ncbi:hypothetical protein WH50_01460 [Pokkaliibacter plantistimulans]|uniref:diguanylate cyclase n=1 Tax=Pokkaliibacter plantistimulans TaxID=1635171 RepID=A0ABX5M3T0_9GAMM|nr:diguanylate cyclase [Pokkaliibacter plantistimulans]PXF33044.1 hypothetical protein WH50_01460 [Pokkaliibacter plantistimulans]